MKKCTLVIAFLATFAFCSAQSQPMKFMGISLNCTQSTFVSKVKGKGFVEDPTRSHDNISVLKGMFAGERVSIQARAAAKTHMMCYVNVNFTRSTSYTYETLKGKLQDKYGTNYKEFKNVKDGEGYVKYATDYIVWETDPDEITGETNRIVLTKCNYNGSSPYVISYIDNKNSKVDTIEINSDF